jgi:hypothetical protein
MVSPRVYARSPFSKSFSLLNRYNSCISPAAGVFSRGERGAGRVSTVPSAREDGAKSFLHTIRRATVD